MLSSHCHTAVNALERAVIFTSRLVYW